MTEPEIRRASDPRVVRKIHSAIKKVCEQKQCPIFDRVQRALSIEKVQINRSKLELQLKHAIRDGLVVENNGKGTKGFGESKTSYRVPSLENFYENYEDDGHDWYCWICHREGEVYLCSRCPRVIHKKCAELTQEELQGDFVCYCCNDLDSTKQYGKKEIQELATMLSYTVDRMKSKCEELWKSPDEEVHPTYKLYVYQDINLNELEKRVVKKEFDSLAKFHYEIEWLFHNTVIYFGGDNKLTDLARMVVLDGQNELSQIDICSECYLRSNDRMKNWFSVPCKPPHRLVYAKLGSDPPWPAKALRDSDDGESMDVRFFGPPHQRAWIPKRSIWDIDNKPAPKKRSKALSQAEDELKVYLRLLARGPKKEKESKSGSDSSEEEIDDDSEDGDQEEDVVKEKYSKIKTSTAAASVKSKNIPTPSGRGRGRPRINRDDDDDDEEEDATDVDNDNDDDEGEKDNIEEDGVNSEDDEDDYDEYEPASKRQKKKYRDRKLQIKREENEHKKRGRKKGGKNKSGKTSDVSTSKSTKAEKRFRELQEKKMMEFQKNKLGKNYKDSPKVDINKNVGSEDGGESEPSEMQLAQQIKMTDDYKMIEKLQERVRYLEKCLEQTRSDYESAQADLESTRIELATEKQKCKRLQEQLEKGAEINEEKLKNAILGKKQEEIDQAVEEERKRNELEFMSRMNEALADERSKCETKFQENIEKERANGDNKAKLLVTREREEVQRNFERYKSEVELKNTRNMEKLKVESDEMMKRSLQDNMRRIQADTERILAAAKKKSWCSNCTKEAFYHCCWNTNYCSTDCQRVHWVSHRFQCTREMMSTCRSCQQRQNFAGSFASQVPPK